MQSCWPNCYSVASRAITVCAPVSSPPRFQGAVGNAAQQHFSLRHYGLALFGGDGPRCLIDADGAAIGGIVRGPRRRPGTAHRVGPLRGRLVPDMWPDEVDTDPSGWTDEDRAAAGVGLPSSELNTILNALDFSERLRRLLGDNFVDATVAVRRPELGA